MSNSDWSNMANLFSVYTFSPCMQEDIWLDEQSNACMNQLKSKIQEITIRTINKK